MFCQSTSTIIKMNSPHIVLIVFRKPQNVDSLVCFIPILYDIYFFDYLSQQQQILIIIDYFLL